MKVIRMFMPAALVLATALAQTPAQRLEFEVVSVKAAPPITAGAPQVNIGLHIDGAQVHLISLSLSDYIRMAYKVKNYQVIGPEWIESERFTVDAKLPAGGAKEQVPEMLKSLLTDRFQLKFHNDTKEFPVYGLETIPGGKLKDLTDASEAQDDKAPTEVNAAGGPSGVAVSLPGGASYSFGDNKFIGKKLTMAYLADTLSRFMDRPVVDMTNLKGKYDINVPLSEDDYRGMLIRSAISAGVALPPEALRYLATISDSTLHSGLRANGLKLETRKAPLQVIVVDSVLKTPTDN
ncbi:MAG TPA: TIGR03435 family protein [Candidatus Sulfopaludibacter sp.]|jgi:uncharacterized protein (TIGR03435 family)|nr:TIGR03435 family protein [Candidatus Sulfopaludibacter sp.]